MADPETIVDGTNDPELALELKQYELRATKARNTSIQKTLPAVLHARVPEMEPEEINRQLQDVEWTNNDNCGSLVLTKELFHLCFQAVYELFWVQAETDQNIKVKWTEVKDRPKTHIVEDKITISHAERAGQRLQRAGTLHLYRTTHRLMFQGIR